MTDLTDTTNTENLRKTLRQRISNALQSIELLDKKDAWIALVKPDRLRRPRRSRAGLNLFEATLWTLAAITLLLSVLQLYKS